MYESDNDVIEAVQRYRLTQAAHAEAMQNIRQLAQVMRERGDSITAIARKFQVTRQTIYTWFDANEKSARPKRKKKPAATVSAVAAGTTV